MHYKWKNQTLVLHCILQPKASKDEITGLQADKLKIRIKAPPVDGKANQYLIKFLSDEFKVPKKNVTIVAGELSRHKTVTIEAPQLLPKAACVKQEIC